MAERLIEKGSEEVYRSMLSRIQGSGRSFVTFREMGTSKFIHFGGIEDTPEFVATIPSAAGNENQPTRVDIEEYYPNFKMSQNPDGVIYTSTCNLEKAVETTHRFFTDLCGLACDFELEVDLKVG